MKKVIIFEECKVAKSLKGKRDEIKKPSDGVLWFLSSLYGVDLEMYNSATNGANPLQFNELKPVVPRPR
jgi:hypothetical protein